MSRRICVMTATRAEYGLLYWLLCALRDDPAIELQLVVAGAHLSPAHGMTVTQIEADGFAIDARVDLHLGDDSPVGVARSLAAATAGFGAAFARLQPDLLVLLGDRYEALGAAQAAMLARLPIAHLHGGEATEGLIDEAIRHAITKMAHLHFVAAEAYRRRVIQLGEAPARVFRVGATGLDNIARLTLPTRAELEAELDFVLGDTCFLVTYHPLTLGTEDPALAFGRLLAALDAFPQARVILTGVNADPGAGGIQAAAEAWAHGQGGRVKLAASLGQRRYLAAMREAAAVIGNSSSGLLEAPAMGVPTVNVGARQRGRLGAPSVIDCADETAAIRAAIERALQPAFRALAARRETPYGTPGVAERIAAVLREHPLDGILFKHFHDLPGAVE